MNAVPTTPTALDRTEEVRKLNVEIATLASARDIVKRETEEAISGVDLLRKKKEILESEIASLELLSIETVQSATNTAKTCVDSIRRASEQVKSIDLLLKELIQRVEAENLKVEKAKEEQKHIHEKIVKENEVLEKKQGDLNIYKRRLEKYFSEYLPDQKITL